MRRTTEIERQKAAILKTARSAIRLRHSLAADAEIARRLPELEEDMDLALAQGESFDFDPREVYAVES